jgi:hypothetical protein
MTPVFRSAEEILSAMSPVLSREMVNDRAAFNIEAMDPLSLTFNTESGFRYAFDPGSVSVAFNHRIMAKASSAGPPTMELISRAAPYTVLLKAVSERLIEAVELLKTIEPRILKRIGIVSVTQIELEDAPPGIVELFKELGKPLGGVVDNFNINITTVIDRNSRHIDRCAHALTLPEQPETLATLTFDWMRTIVNPSAAHKSAITDILKNGERDALAYFERLAEGGLSDAGE